MYPILKEGSNEHDKTFDLPDGWTKKIIQRQGGASVGSWDAYLTPPRQYNHKRLRSVIELAHFLMKFPDCSIDCRHVNMEKLPEVVTGSEDRLGSTTKRLMSFVEALKRGDSNVTVETHFGAHKSSKKVLKEKTIGSDENKPKVKRKYTKKAKEEVPEEVKPVLPQFTLDQTLKLEKLLHASARVPTPDELDEWSSALKADYNDVHDWFRIKWRARLEYEVSVAKQAELILNDAGENDWTFNRHRQIQRFDVPFMHDPLIQNDEANVFDIGNEDGEEDIVNTVNAEVDENAGDVIVDDEEFLLPHDYGEITIEEHCPTMEDDVDMDEETWENSSYSLPG